MSQLWPLSAIQTLDFRNFSKLFVFFRMGFIHYIFCIYLVGLGCHTIQVVRHNTSFFHLSLMAKRVMGEVKVIQPTLAAHFLTCWVFVADVHKATQPPLLISLLLSYRLDLDLALLCNLVPWNKAGSM